MSKLQSVAGKGTVKDMRERNKVLEYALSTSDEGIYFSSEGIDWDEAVVCTITDEEVSGSTEEHMSQQGAFICSAPAGVVNATIATVHPIC